MNSSPTAMRMIDDRMSSEPMSGPTVVRLRGCPPSGLPNRATSARSTSAHWVLLAIGAAEGDAAGDAAALGLADPVGLPSADALDEGEADSAPLADGTTETLGSGVGGGSRPIGSVRISR